MADYRYTVYNRDGELVAEATSLEDATKEAKRVGGYWKDRGKLPIRGVRLDRIDKVFAAPDESRYATRNPKSVEDYEAESDPVAVRELLLFAQNDGKLYERQTKYVESNLERKLKSGRYNHDLAYKAFLHVLDEAAKEYNRLYGSGTRSMGSSFSKADRVTAAREWADEWYAEAELQTASRQRNPAHGPARRRRNPEGDQSSDFQRGFADGLLVVAEASAYFANSRSGRRANPEPRPITSESLEYKAGFVAATRLFAVPTLTEVDAAWSVLDAFGNGGGMPRPTGPVGRPPRPPREPREPRGGGRRPKPVEPGEPGSGAEGLSKLARVVLNTIPPTANTPDTRVSKAQILEALKVTKPKAYDILSRSKPTWGNTMSELTASGLVARSGEKRGIGYYLLGEVPTVTGGTGGGGERRRVKPVAKPKPQEEAKPTRRLNDREWMAFEAAALANGAVQEDIDAMKKHALKLLAETDRPVVATLVTVNTPAKMMVAEAKTLSAADTIAAIPAHLGKGFDLTLTQNPWYGHGKSRVWGAWG